MSEEKQPTLEVAAAKTKTKVTVPAVVEVKGVYATEYFKRNGIPYCEKCGAQYQTGLNEEPICPENFTSANCPRLGN